MTGRRLLAGALAAGAALAGAALAAPAWADDPAAALVITGVQPAAGSVQFFVAGRGLPVGPAGLAGARITVRAAGQELRSTVRAVATAGRAAPPTGVVLVMDTSGSMAGGRLAAAQAAAADFAATAPPAVRLGLVTVSDRPAVALAPTTDRAAFRAAVGRVRASGNTALYDGLAAAQRLLDPAASPAAAELAERRVVVLSDGADTASKVRPDALAAQLARADATVDAVAFGEADRAALTALAGVTGGRVVPAAGGAALRAVLRGLASELTAPVVVSATVPPTLSGRSATLTVTATAGGTRAEGTAAVRFRVDPAAAAGPAQFRAPRTPAVALWTAVAALSAALLIVGLLVFLPLLGRGAAQRRIGQLDRYVVARRAQVGRSSGEQGGPMLRAALAVSERAVRRPDRRERIELALDRAGSPLRAAEWQLIRVGVTVGAALLVGLLLTGWLGLALGALGGWLGTGQYLRLRAGRRTRRFADQLPDALQLVVGSLRSGFSLPQSLDALVREGADPVAGELGRALAETRLGGDLEDALERVGQRNTSQDMSWLVMAIRIQREVGGNLSEVLETAVGTMRERARLFRHVRALSAEGRLSALILLGMPIVLGGWMFVFRREYLRPLYTEPMGLLMLGGSVVMVIVGGLWLRKLVQVEV